MILPPSNEIASPSATQLAHAERSTARSSARRSIPACGRADAEGHLGIAMMIEPTSDRGSRG
jgi:hypothetical protein